MTKKPNILKRAVSHEGSIASLFRKTLTVISQEGLGGIQKRLRHLSITGSQVAPAPAQPLSYLEWLEQIDEQPADYARWLLRSNPKHIKFSIVCPVYEPDPEFLKEAITSVLNQSYQRFELILVDDKSPTFNLHSFLESFNDERIVPVYRESNGNISQATNSGINAATGTHIAFMDQDDVLVKDALIWSAATLVKHPQVKLIYSDEDKLDELGNRCDPHFKPDWNYQYFLACNYICHFVVVERDLVRSVGGCRPAFDGAQDYDFLLRTIEKIDSHQIFHIPTILYHWRKHDGSTSSDILSKPEALNAGQRAVQDHLIRQNIDATVEMNNIRYAVKFASSDEPVTLIIPTRNMHSILKPCIDSIRAKTNHKNYHILVVDNGSDDPESIAYLESIKSFATVIKDDRDFNFSALINGAVEKCETELICLVNNDVEVISDDWLTEMVSVAQQDRVQVVGAKLLYDDNTVQHGGVILGIGGVAGHAHKFFPSDSGGYSDRNVCRQELSAVTGACLLTRKSVHQEVGGLDEENLTIAFNDIDYCLKVRARGYKVVWTPHAQLYHHESKSRGHEDSPQKIKRFNLETQRMKSAWGSELYRDPAYNPNLTLEHEDYSLNPAPTALDLELPRFQL